MKYTKLKTNPSSNPGFSNGSSLQAKRFGQVTGKLSGTRKASSFAEVTDRSGPTRSAPKGGRGSDPVGNQESRKYNEPIKSL